MHSQCQVNLSYHHFFVDRKLYPNQRVIQMVQYGQVDRLWVVVVHSVEAHQLLPLLQSSLFQASSSCHKMHFQLTRALK